VLGPEQREDGELEVVRRPPEQGFDPFELAVGQPKSTMERLLGNLFGKRRQRTECRRSTGNPRRPGDRRGDGG
jgi:hypothetical protein